MTVEELCKQLQRINNDYGGDEEACHLKMDEALLDYINDGKVTRLLHKADKWYA